MKTADDYLDAARAICRNGCRHTQRAWACQRCQDTALLVAEAVNAAITAYEHAVVEEAKHGPDY